MAKFEKGNKAAVGNKGGRPRTSSPSPEECIALGEEMIAWVAEHKPTHLSEWFSIEKMILWKVWDNMVETAEFSPYYEMALSMVAQNCRNGTLDKTLASRFLSLYHRDLKRDEYAKLKYESDLRKVENEVVTEAEFAKKAEAGELTQK